MSISRRNFLHQAAVAAAAVALPACVSDSSHFAFTPKRRPPNVIILLADDQGCGDLSCAGHPILRTPALDRLANEGVRFTNFYSSAPVCSPARAGLMTGRIQNRFGMDHLINIEETVIPQFHHVPPQEPTIAKQLRRAGYRTGHVGKWHLNFMGRPGEPTWNDYGFDEAVLLGADRYTGYYNSKWTRHTGERFTTEGRWSAEVYVDEAISFIERAGNQPFFLNLWSFTPHAEVNCPPEYRAKFKELTEAEQYYYGALTQMDDQYGRLLNYLDQHGLAENTIVIFSSDNGAEPPILPWTKGRSRGRTGRRGSKHNLGDGGLLVPGLIRWPATIEPGTVSNVPVSSLDLLPTLSAAAGVPLPQEWGFDGGNLLQAVTGHDVDRAHPLYWQFKAVSLMEQYGNDNLVTPVLALRDGRWKLFSDLQFEHPELYNLHNDPNEQWNMAEEYPEIVERMMRSLKEIYKDVNGPYSREADFLNPSIKKRN